MNNHPQYPPRQIFKINGKLLDEKIYNAKCIEFTHPSVIKNMNSKTDIRWADDENPRKDILEERETFNGSGNGLKSLIDAEIVFNSKNKPMNPTGWTGLAGRGLLGKWGPNHAADPIVSYLDENNDLWAIVIRRKDTGEWAIPGGMVDPGDNVSHTLINEIFEEAIETDNDSDSIMYEIIDLFNNSIVLYNGYVNDPRNTDNAWMETTVCGILINKDQKQKIRLRKEDTEKNTDSTKWIKVCENSLEFTNIYADHKYYLLLMKAAVSGMEFYRINNEIPDKLQIHNNNRLIQFYLITTISIMTLFIAYLL